MWALPAFFVEIMLNYLKPFSMFHFNDQERNPM